MMMDKGNSVANLTLCVPRPSHSHGANEPVIIHTEQPTLLPPNHVLIAVDRFGFSANNITYQTLGEEPHFRYFDFHATPTGASAAGISVSPETHGVVPVWGFGTIVASTHAKIRLGERIYGYLAPTRYLMVPVSPSDVHRHAFYIPRPHLPADRRPYNQIIRCLADAQYDPSPDVEDFTMLYRPLFWTSYWCEDWLYASSYRGGATRVLVSSASSKTALCLAYRIRKRAVPGMQVVGLTSPRNVAFTRGLPGLYDVVLGYDADFGPALAALDAAPAAEKWIYVDVAGDGFLNDRIFECFDAGAGSASSGRLVAAIALGMTTLSPATRAPGAPLSADWTAGSVYTTAPAGAGANSAQPRPQPLAKALEPFFMVEWLAVRRRQMSPADMAAAQNAAWAQLMSECRDWVRIERVYGGDGVKAAYAHVAQGRLGPDRGYVWSLWPENTFLTMMLTAAEASRL